jgi:GH15 family glucan-1,4-alpha-glucosidase
VTSEDPPGYLPIRDYAAIGDCHGSALVSRCGRIDWCGLERFDADPIFCRVLDDKRGGFLSTRPARPFETLRGYQPDTNILETQLRTDRGAVKLTDFMPVGRRSAAGTHDYVDLEAPHWLVRRVQGLEGCVDLDLCFRPCLDFAQKPARLKREGGQIRVVGGPIFYTDAPLELAEERAEGRTTIRAGEQLRLVIAGSPAPGDPLARVDGMLSATRAFWEEWAAYGRYPGPVSRCGAAKCAGSQADDLCA